MNETLHLREHMSSPQGWGRADGREVYQRLLRRVESTPGTMVFRVSLAGVQRLDISFASETVVELARRFRGIKGFCLVDIADADMLENWEAAAQRKAQPIVAWGGTVPRVLGVEPTPGTLPALRFALERPRVRATEFAAAVPGMSLANASTKFKQLWEQGFLLRREESARSGGVEFSYFRIG